MFEEAPGEEEQDKDAEDYPACSLEYQLYMLDLRADEITHETIECVPEQCCYHLEEQETRVVHLGDASTERDKGVLYSHLTNLERRVHTHTGRRADPADQSIRVYSARYIPLFSLHSSSRC